MKLNHWLILLIGFGGAALAAPPAFSAELCSDKKLTTEQRRTCERPWTLLVYMAAANNLSPYAMWDLSELESVGSGANIDIVVQIDLPGNDGAKRLHLEKSKQKYSESDGLEKYEKLKITDLESKVLESVPETGTEESRLKNFMTWGLKSYPSKQVAAVIWGHGQGWMGTSVRTQTGRLGGIGLNDETKSKMSIPGLKRALSGAAKASRAGKPYDLLISDACLMQMGEVITQMSDTARILVGSSQIQNFLGIPYARLLESMNSKVVRDAKDPAYEISKRISGYMKAFLNKAVKLKTTTRAAGFEMGMSTVNAAEWTNVTMPAFKRFFDSIRNEWAGEQSLERAFMEASENAMKYQSGGVEWGTWLLSFSAETRDQLRGTASTIPQKTNDLIDAVNRAITAYAVGKTNENWGKRSLSLWVPANEGECKERYKDFAKSDFYEKTGFGEVLKLMYPKCAPKPRNP